MIAFSGIDGAGKSTQIELLREALAKQGRRSEVFWSRGGYTPGMLRLKAIFGISKNVNLSSKRLQNRNQRRENVLSNQLMRKVWLTLAILDLIFFYSVYIRIKEFLGVVIICDRHLMDTEIDFELNFPDDNVSHWLLWRFLKISLKKPTKYFIAIIPVEESVIRSKLKGEPFPDKRITLERRLSVYEQFLNKYPYALRIDGTLTVDEIHTQIIDEIEL